MLEIKARGSRSWLCNIQAPLLSAVLRSRLRARLANAKGLFITLTYDRSNFASPRDLYARQAREQHVPMFMRRLKRALGVKSLKGKWMRKMEFQRGGWVHFHMVLLWPTTIDWKLIQECWGHGYIFVGRLDPDTHIGYLSKYLSKDEPIPPFLYAEKPRSVKVVASSPGFWGDTSPRDYVERIDPATRLPCYQPIGDRIKIGSQTLIVRDTDRGVYSQLISDQGTLVHKLRRAGVPYTFVAGWLRAYCDFDRLCAIAREDAPELRDGPAGPAGPAEVNLIHIQNPDSGAPPWGEPEDEDDRGLWGRDRVGPWMAQMFAQPTDDELCAAQLAAGY